MRVNQERKPFADAMAFYHEDGLPSAWMQAKEFAGKKGRLATLPEIAIARIETKPGDAPWESYYTTLTAEYYGISKSGKRILIIAHGVGPMATLEGILKVYSFQYKDKSRSNRGGRITEQEFWDLEAGKFGPVTVVDLEAYCKKYDYPFIQILRFSEAVKDKVLLARLGDLALEYLHHHAYVARRWHKEQLPGGAIDPGEYLGRIGQYHANDSLPGSDPYIIRNQGANNCAYYFGAQHGFRPIEKGFAIAHLIATSGLMHMCHDGRESLVLDIGCHEWNDGVRLVGVKEYGSLKSGIHVGPDPQRILSEHWKKLLQPIGPQEPIGFRGLMQVGKQWFTQYPKVGERMDTWEPEYVVTSIEKVGKPAIFRTTVGGYHGFFKFGMKEVKAIAPPEANAYFFVGQPVNEWNDGNPTHQTCPVQFYKIEVDSSKRLRRAHDLAHDYKTMMELLEKEKTAA